MARTTTSETASSTASEFGTTEIPGIRFVDYKDESQLDHVMNLVASDLSEPYSSTSVSKVSFNLHTYVCLIKSSPTIVFTYRYFLHRFPQLCILAVPEDDLENPIGCVVGKIDDEEPTIPSGDETAAKVKVGYLGMLAVGKGYRRRGIGKALVQQVLDRMQDRGCESVILETEVTNTTAQRLYQDSFGFVREELLVRYYLNWNDAYRLRLWFSQ